MSEHRQNFKSQYGQALYLNDSLTERVKRIIKVCYPQLQTLNGWIDWQYSTDEKMCWTYFVGRYTNDQEIPISLLSMSNKELKEFGRHDSKEFDSTT